VSIDNKTVLECLPTDASREPYIIDNIEINALGYTCLSAKDRGDVKKFMKQVIKKLDEL